MSFEGNTASYYVRHTVVPKLLHDSNNNAARSYGCDTARTTSKRACRRGEAIISNSVCAYVMGRRVNGHDVRSRLHIQPRREIPRRFVCARQRNNVLRGCTTARESLLDRACLSSVRLSSLERTCFPFSSKLSFSHGESGTPKPSRMCPARLSRHVGTADTEISGDAIH